MNYKELQTLLRSFKEQKLTNIALNSSREILEQEYRRLSGKQKVDNDTNKLLSIVKDERKKEIDQKKQELQEKDENRPCYDFRFNNFELWLYSHNLVINGDIITDRNSALVKSLYEQIKTYLPSDLKDYVTLIIGYEQIETRTKRAVRDRKGNLTKTDKPNNYSLSQNKNLTIVENDKYEFHNGKLTVVTLRDRQGKDNYLLNKVIKDTTYKTAVDRDLRITAKDLRDNLRFNLTMNYKHDIKVHDYTFSVYLDNKGKCSLSFNGVALGVIGQLHNIPCNRTSYKVARNINFNDKHFKISFIEKYLNEGGDPSNLVSPDHWIDAIKVKNDGAIIITQLPRRSKDNSIVELNGKYNYLIVRPVAITNIVTFQKATMVNKTIGDKLRAVEVLNDNERLSLENKIKVLENKLTSTIRSNLIKVVDFLRENGITDSINLLQETYSFKDRLISLKLSNGYYLEVDLYTGKLSSIGKSNGKIISKVIANIPVTNLVSDINGITSKVRGKKIHTPSEYQQVIARLDHLNKASNYNLEDVIKCIEYILQQCLKYVPPNIKLNNGATTRSVKDTGAITDRQVKKNKKLILKIWNNGKAYKGLFLEGDPTRQQLDILDLVNLLCEIKDKNGIPLLMSDTPRKLEKLSNTAVKAGYRLIEK